MSSRSLLSVRDLSVAFSAGKSRMLAVDRASFQIGKGETVALVGESGSGKTVSALSILRLLSYPAASHPSGEIWFEGRDLLTATERQMQSIRGDRISIIFQEPMTSLNPAYTIGNQLEEGIRLHKNVSAKEARERAIYLLEKVGITAAASRLGQYPHQLSGGLRQRVMIAMALANDPDIIIADEPTTALDVTVQAQILSLLDDLRRDRGLAIVFITHDFGVVGQLCDRVAVMYAGRIVEEGPTQAGLDAPAHPYTWLLYPSPSPRD